MHAVRKFLSRYLHLLWTNQQELKIRVQNRAQRRAQRLNWFGKIELTQELPTISSGSSENSPKPSCLGYRAASSRCQFQGAIPAVQKNHLPNC